MGSPPLLRGALWRAARACPAVGGLRPLPRRAYPSRSSALTVSTTCCACTGFTR
jgi:hypothetical protein